MPPGPYLVAAVCAVAFVVVPLARAARRREAELRNRLQDVTVELEQANARLEEMATRDDLTGIRNRRFFFDQIDLEWRRAAGAHQPVSLVVADLDVFKALNETYGQIEGDSALARVAACMRAAARRTTDCVARTGGEEFAILLPGTPAEGAVAFAERVRRDVEALRIPNAQSPAGPTLTVSLGVSTVRPRTGNDAQVLVAAADRGLQRSKASGRNRVTFEECRPNPAAASAQG